MNSISFKLKTLHLQGILGLILSLHTAGCTDNKGFTVLAAPELQTQVETGSSYMLVHVRGFEPHCLELKATSSTTPPSSRKNHHIAIQSTNIDRCDQSSLEIKAPGFKAQQASDNRLYPYWIGMPPEWMENEILFGGCSLEFQIGEHPVTVHYDICENQIITDVFKYSSKEHFTVSKDTDLSVVVVSLTEKDKELKQIAERAVTYYDLAIYNAISSSHNDLDPDQEKQIWNTALKKAKAEQ